MEMHQLRYFVAVAREGNFTRAARACHVSQPSLSQQIRKLEEELGQSLLHRLKSGKSILTAAGELFFPRAIRILQEAKVAASELEHIGDSVSGSVRMGAIPTLAPYLVPDSVLRFNRDYPNVELIVHETTTAELLAMLWRNELDFALASPPFTGGPWESQSLGVESLLLATAAETTLDIEQRPADEAQGAGKKARAKKGARPGGKPVAAQRQTDGSKAVAADNNKTTTGASITLNDLAGEEFILMREGHCLSNQVLGFCQQADFKPKVRFLSAQVETLKALIRAGAGISLLPSLAVNPADPTLRYIRLDDKPAPQREIVALWRPEFPLRRAATEFIRYLRQTLDKRLKL